MSRLPSSPAAGSASAKPSAPAAALPPPRPERASRWLTVVGGIGFTSLILLFLAWIQPVNSEKGKIELPPTFTFKLQAAPKKAPPPSQQKETTKEVAKKEPPKRKPKRASSPRPTAKPRSARPAATPSLRAAPQSAAPVGMNLAAGVGGGGGPAMTQTFLAAQNLNYQEAEQANYQARNKALAERGRFESRAKRVAVAGSQARDAAVAYSPDPDYPPAARQAGAEGAVRFRCLVDIYGKVQDVEIEFSENPGYFEDAIRETVPSWQFDPALDEQGRPIQEWVSVVYKFELKE